MTRRDLLKLTGALLAGLPACTASERPEAAATASQASAVVANLIPIEIWKSPTCGCCEKWVEHIKANGFQATIHDVDDIAAVKRKVGVPVSAESCHTAVVGRYAIEGHVPADLIHQALKEQPDIAGLAAPGMPVGSPGMEVPGGRKDTYDIVAFDKAGKTRVYASR